MRQASASQWYAEHRHVRSGVRPNVAGVRRKTSCQEVSMSFSLRQRRAIYGREGKSVMEYSWRWSPEPVRQRY
eukprot:12989579-Heterocapsa_arctica.AAC.1